MMTLADLDAISADLEALRAAWAEALLVRVERTLSDALAHAEKAITESLKATAEGRATARKAIRSASYEAATNRLAELWVRLAGPSETSLRGKIRDAREAFYRRAFDLHRPWVPSELLIKPDPMPTQRAIAMVRGAPLHGYDPRRELAKPIGDAIRTLGAAATMAGSRLTTARDETQILTTWQTRAQASISQCVLTLLSDSVAYAESEARGDLIHPDYRLAPRLAAQE